MRTSKLQNDLLNSENLKVATDQLCNELQVCNFTIIQLTHKYMKIQLSALIGYTIVVYASNEYTQLFGTLLAAVK